MRSIPTHWNGVSGLGMNDEAESVTYGRRVLPRTSLPMAAILCAKSTSPSTSASVSVGSPIMK